jgi:hypothetical protein
LTGRIGCPDRLAFRHAVIIDVLGPASLDRHRDEITPEFWGVPLRNRDERWVRLDEVRRPAPDDGLRFSDTASAQYTVRFEIRSPLGHQPR